MALNPSANAASIPAMVAERVAAHGAQTILRKKDRGIWKAVSWTELGEHVRAVALGLLAYGFGPRGVACTLAETRPEWVYIDLGVLSVGGTSGGIHPAVEDEHLGEALHAVRCSVLFVENEEQLDKALAARGHCPALQRIVILDMKGLRDFADAMCESFAEFVARGAEYDRAHQGDYAKALAAVTAELPAILQFPPGATSDQTRVLTHGEVLRLLRDAQTVLQPRAGDERVALLPMSDAVERVYGLYLALDARAVSNYLESPDTAVENLQEVQPALLGTDRQIWERLHGLASGAASGATHVQRMLYRGAVAAGQRGGLLALLARLLVLRAVRRELGLARLRLAYIGGEHLAPEVEHWARALGVTVRQVDSEMTAGTVTDARGRTSMEEAYST